MKKTLALLMLTAMILSTGCGNQAQDAAKDAQQKVEQKAGEAKDAANKAADEASKKADEMKADADKMASDMKDAANQAADDASKKVDEMANDMTSMMNERAIALGGVMPGTSVDDLKAKFGEAISVEGNTMTFADGLKVVLDEAKKVKSISTTANAFDTPEGVYVGASEYSLNDYCGPADNVRVANGVAEYEYNSGDKKSVVVYKAQDGVITEIICSLK
ncbi:MAG: hypothetical protein IJG80_03030 [Selenomonadaceae bacterium]|nr:hypothetical protein [Selenomonadaceae bacterium]MBQ3726122.1 hypothetical protein [Selenomonadaceae bacterium]